MADASADTVLNELLDGISLSGSDDSSSDVLDVALDTNGSQVSFAISDVTDKTKTARDVFRVPEDFQAKLGAKIHENLYIHGFIAGGWQGGIFELADGKGNIRQDIVLKTLNATAVLGDLEKEWVIGQSLNVLSKKDGSLPGFMRTAEALRSERNSSFKGMLLERLNGKVVHKTISDKCFNDIHYVRDMLFQVFTALDTAYTVMGFHHTDLRLVNIMEHYKVPGDVSTRQFKIIDFGLAYLEKRNSKLFKKLAKNVFTEVRDPAQLRKVFISAVNPKEYVGKMVNTGYRVFWYQHDDVYHLLTSMTTYLDGRIWPVEDKDAVMEFRELLRYVTGTKLKVYFTDKYQVTGCTDISEHPQGRKLFNVGNTAAATANGSHAPASASEDDVDDSRFRFDPEDDEASSDNSEQDQHKKHAVKPEKGVVKHRGMVQGLRIFANKLRSHLGMFHHSNCSPTQALKFPFFKACHQQAQCREFCQKLARTYTDNAVMTSTGCLCPEYRKTIDGVMFTHDIPIDDEIEVEWDPSVLGSRREIRT